MNERMENAEWSNMPGLEITELEYMGRKQQGYKLKTENCENNKNIRDLLPVKSGLANVR